MIRYFLVYLVLINLATYGVYLWDRYRARTGGRRISRGELLLWALAGGALGAVICLRRHPRTPAAPLETHLLGIMAAQVGLFLWWGRS